MTFVDLDLVAAPGRHVFQINDRVTVVALEPLDGVVILGFFFDGQLVRMTEEA